MDQVVVWDGWVGGIGVGLFMLGLFWLTGRALGASTGYGNVCAFASRSTFFRTGPYADRTGWRLWFTLGIPLGGLLGVLLSPGATFAPGFSMGALYDGVLPDALWARAPILALGGVAVGYGARLAGGCTSGHSITGVSMLNPPSIFASIGFFLGGIAVVQILFRAVG